MNKSIIKVLLLLVFVSGSYAEAKLRVFACEPEWQSLAKELGGDKVKAISATTAFQDAHHIEARPSLIAKTRRTDLLICTGAELEVGWLPLLLRQSGNRTIQIGQPGYFLAAEQVETIEVPTQMDRSLGDIHPAGNPHLHLGPYRMMTVAEALTERLQTIDTGNSDYYEQRLQSFKQRWSSAITEWEQQAAPLKGKKAVVNHKNFSYLLRWLGVEVIGDLEPKPGIPPTSAHLAKLLDKVKSNRPDFILVAAYQDDKGAKWLADKSQVPMVTLPFTVGGNKASTDLFQLYENTIALLLNQVND